MIMLTCIAYGQVRDVDTTIFEYQDKGKFPVANSYKLPENPVVVDTIRIVPAMNYSISTKPAYPPVYLVPMKAAKMEGEPLKKLYGGYLVAGMGTYTMPLLDFRYNNLRSKTNSYGIHLKHLSSSARLANRGYAGWSDDVVEGNLKYFMKKHSLNTVLGYTRNGVHYYGFNDTINVIENNDYTKQVFHRTDLGMLLQSHYSDSSRLNQRIGVEFHSLFDNYDVNESNLLLTTELGMEWKRNYLGGIFTLDYLNDKQKFIDTNNSIIASLEPYFKFIGKKFRAKLGATLAMDFSAKNRIYFYPAIEVNYNIANYILVPYAGVSGALQRNSYQSISKDNPFIDPSNAFTLKNSHIPIEFYGGLRGSLSSAVSYNVKVAYRKINDAFFYATDTVNGVPDLFELLENRFNVVYDSVKNFEFSGELKFSRSEKFSLLLKGEYNTWTMNAQRYPWHKPTMRISACVRYDLRSKIIINLDAFFASSVLAPVTRATASDGLVELRGYFDVNLKTTYNYNKRLSFFLSLNNLASSRYQRWYNYPGQRLQIMGGVSLSF